MNEKQINGALYGFIVGDALGVPVEFKKREYLKQNPIINMMENKYRKTTKGYWSDDTAMTLCTVRSIIDVKGVNIKLQESIMNNYLKWADKGYMAINNRTFGIGQATLRSMMEYSKSKSFEEYYENKLKKEEKRNGGNGALMRILPLILYLYQFDFSENEKISETENLNRKYEFIEFNVRLTHNNFINAQSCIFYTMFIFNLLETNNLNESYDLSIRQFKERYKYVPQDLKRIISKKVIYADEDEIKSTGYVVYTLEASLWCLFNSNDFKELVLKAVNLGEDADTVGAITGSLGGIYYTYNQIPEDLLNQLCEKDMIDTTIKEYKQKILYSNNSN